jgi:hypothetical protein
MPAATQTPIARGTSQTRRGRVPGNTTMQISKKQRAALGVIKDKLAAKVGRPRTFSDVLDELITNWRAHNEP